MYEILKELLLELKTASTDICPIIMPLNIDKKVIALESAIEVLEKLRSETDEEN